MRTGAEQLAAIGTKKDPIERSRKLTKTEVFRKLLKVLLLCMIVAILLSLAAVSGVKWGNADITDTLSGQDVDLPKAEAHGWTAGTHGVNVATISTIGTYTSTATFSTGNMSLGSYNSSNDAPNPNITGGSTTGFTLVDGNARNKEHNSQAVAHFQLSGGTLATAQAGKLRVVFSGSMKVNTGDDQTMYAGVKISTARTNAPSNTSTKLSGFATSSKACTTSGENANFSITVNSTSTASTVYISMGFATHCAGLWAGTRKGNATFSNLKLTLTSSDAVAPTVTLPTVSSWSTTARSNKFSIEDELYLKSYQVNKKSITDSSWTTGTTINVSGKSYVFSVSTAANTDYKIIVSDFKGNTTTIYFYAYYGGSTGDTTTGATKTYYRSHQNWYSTLTPLQSPTGKGTITIGGSSTSYNVTKGGSATVKATAALKDGHVFNSFSHSAATAGASVGTLGAVTKSGANGTAYRTGTMTYAAPSPKVNSGTVSAQTLYSPNVNITVNWTPVKYYLKFDANGGTGSMNVANATFDTYSTLPSCSFARIGYVFAGWRAGSAASVAKYLNNLVDTTLTTSITLQNGAKVKNLTTTYGADVSIVAQWTPRLYSIIFSYNLSATSTESSTLTGYYDAVIGSFPAAPGTLRNGYVFDGWWTTAGQKVTSSTTITTTNLAGLSATADSAYTIYAKWVANKYSIGYVQRPRSADNMMSIVQYDYNDGKGDMLLGTAASTPSYSIFTAVTDYAYHSFIRWVGSGGTAVTATNLFDVAQVNLSNTATTYQVFAEWSLKTADINQNLDIRIVGTLPSGTEIALAKGGSFIYGTYDSIKISEDAAKAGNLNGYVNVAMLLTGHNLNLTGGTTINSRQDAGAYTYNIKFTYNSTEVSESATYEVSFSYQITKYLFKLAFANTSTTAVYGNVDYIGYLNNYTLTSTAGAAMLSGYSNYTLSIKKDGADVYEARNVGLYTVTFTNNDSNFQLYDGANAVPSVNRPDFTVTPYIYNVSFASGTEYDSLDHYDELDPVFTDKDGGAVSESLQTLIGRSYTRTINGSGAVLTVVNAGNYNIVYTLTDGNFQIGDGVSTVVNAEYVIEKYKLTVSIATGEEYNGSNQASKMVPVLKGYASGEAPVIPGTSTPLTIDWTYTVNGQTAPIANELKSAGTYTVIFTNNDENFTVVNASGESYTGYYVISQKAASIRVNAANYTYTYSGNDRKSVLAVIQTPISDALLVQGDTVGYTDILEMKNAGTYKVLYSNPNYLLTVVNGEGAKDSRVTHRPDGSVEITFTIERATLTFDGIAYSVIYEDGLNLIDRFSAPLKTFVGGESAAIFNTTYRDAQKAVTSEFSNVGIYYIEIVGNGNYNITNTGYESLNFRHAGTTYTVVTITESEGIQTALITVEVAKKKITVTPLQSTGSVYGVYDLDTVKALFQYSLTDKLTGQAMDASTATVTLYIDSIAVGTHPIRFDEGNSYVSSQFEANYELEFTDTVYTHTVSRAQIVLSLSNETVGYGEDYSFPYVYSASLAGSAVASGASVTTPLYFGDVLTVSPYTVTRGVFGKIQASDTGYSMTIDAGKVAVMNGGSNVASNYNIVYNEARLYIEKAELTVRFVSQDELSSYYGAVESVIPFQLFLDGNTVASTKLYYASDDAKINGLVFRRSTSHVDYSVNADLYEITSYQQISTTAFTTALVGGTEQNYIITYDVPYTIYYRVLPIEIALDLSDISVLYGSAESGYVQSLANSIHGVELSTIPGAPNAFVYDEHGQIAYYSASGRMGTGAILTLHLKRSGDSNVGDYTIEIWNLYIEPIASGAKEYIVRDGGDKVQLVNYGLTEKTTAEYRITPRSVYILPLADQSMTYGENPQKENNLSYSYEIAGDSSLIQLQQSDFNGALLREGAGSVYNAGSYPINIGTLEILTGGVQKGNFALFIRETDKKNFTIKKAVVTVTPVSQTVEYGDNAKTLTFGVRIVSGTNSTNITTAGVDGGDYGAYHYYNGQNNYFNANGYSATADTADSFRLGIIREPLSESVSEQDIRISYIRLNGALVADLSGYSLAEYNARGTISLANYEIKIETGAEYVITRKNIGTLIEQQKGSLFSFDLVKDYDGTRTVSNLTVYSLTVTKESGGTETVSLTAVLSKSGYANDASGAYDTTTVNVGKNKYICIYFDINSTNYESETTYVYFADAEITPKPIEIIYEYNQGGVTAPIVAGAQILIYNGMTQSAAITVRTEDLVGQQTITLLKNYQWKNGGVYGAASEVFYAGEYIVSVTQPEVGGNGNYVIAEESLSISFTVGKAALSVKPTAGLSSIYGETLKPLSLMTPVLQGTDGYEATLKLLPTTDKSPIPAGIYTVGYEELTITGTGGITDVTFCYDIQFDSTVTYEVKQSALVLIAGNYYGLLNSYYGAPVMDMDSVVVLNVQSGALVVGHTRSAAFEKAAGTDAGVYAVHAVVSIFDEYGDDVSASYAVTISNIASVSYEIAKLPLTITPITVIGGQQLGSKYHSPYETINYTVETTVKTVTLGLSGGTLVNGDPYEIVLCPNGAQSGVYLSANDYSIARKTLSICGVDYSGLNTAALRTEVKNYDITFNNSGKYYRVSPAEVRVVPLNVTVTYGDIAKSGNDYSDLVCEVYLDGVRIEGDKAALSLYETDTVDISNLLTRRNGSDEDTYVISKGGTYTFSAPINYVMAGSDTAVYTVLPMQLTLTASDLNVFTKTYDGTAAAVGITLVAPLSGAYGESVTFQSINGTFNSKNAGEANSIDSISLVYHNGFKNYVIGFASGLSVSGTIIPKEIAANYSGGFLSDGILRTAYSASDLLLGTVGVSVLDDAVVPTDIGRVGVSVEVFSSSYTVAGQPVQALRNAGTYRVGAVLHGIEAGNYAIRAEDKERTVIIDAVTVRLSVDAVSIAYGDWIETALYDEIVDPISGIVTKKIKAYTVVGLIGADDLEDYLDLYLAPAVAVGRNELQDVGMYDLSFGCWTKAGAAPNYIIDNDNENCKYFVVPREVKVDIAPVRKVYGTSDSAVDWKVTLTNAVELEKAILTDFIAKTRITRSDKGEDVGSYTVEGLPMPTDGTYSIGAQTLTLKNYTLEYVSEYPYLIIDKKTVSLTLTKTSLDLIYGEAVPVTELFYQSGILNLNPTEIAERDKIMTGGHLTGYSIAELKLPAISLSTSRDVGTHTVPVGAVTSKNYTFTLSAATISVSISPVTLKFVPTTRENYYEVPVGSALENIVASDLYWFEGLQSGYQHSVVLALDYNAVDAALKADARTIIILVDQELDTSVAGKGQIATFKNFRFPQEELNNLDKPYGNYNVLDGEYTIVTWVTKTKAYVAAESFYTFTYDMTAKDIMTLKNAPKVFKDSSRSEILAVPAVGYYTVYVKGDSMTEDYFDGYLGEGVYPINAGTYYARLTTVGDENYDGIDLVIEVIVEKSLAISYTSSYSKAVYGDQNVRITLTVNGLSADTQYQNRVFTYDVDITDRNAGDYKVKVLYMGSDNYAAQEIECIYVIDRAQLTVLFSESSFVYEGKAINVPYTVTGAVKGETVSVTESYNNGTSLAVSAGAHTLTLYSRSNNYEIINPTLQFVVTKKTVIVLGEDVTVRKNDVLNTQPTYEGFVGGDDETVLLSDPRLIFVTEVMASTGTPGVFEVLYSGLVADNYAFVYRSFVLTVYATSITNGNNTVEIGGEFDSSVKVEIISRYYTEVKSTEADAVQVVGGKEYQKTGTFLVNLDLGTVHSDMVELRFRLDGVGSDNTNTFNGDVSGIKQAAGGTVKNGALTVKKGFNSDAVTYLLVKKEADGTYKILENVTYDEMHAILRISSAEASGEYIIYSYVETAASYGLLLIIGGCILAIILGLFIMFAVKKR